MKHNIFEDYVYFVNASCDLAERLSRIEKEFKLKAKREYRHGHYLEGDAYARKAWGAEVAVNSIKLTAIYSKEELKKFIKEENKA